MYICNICGYRSIKWSGKCPSCGNWESLGEVLDEPKVDNLQLIEFKGNKPLPLSALEEDKLERIHTDRGEFDRILGGGLVSGELVLVGGEPGVGKSTLLLEVANWLSKDNKVLYVSAEESTQQIKIRAKRLGIDSTNLFILNDNNLEKVSEYVREEQFRVLIVDSIQVVYHPKIQGATGSVLQIKGSASFLNFLAKSYNVAVFIIGHVTKEGMISGPKLLEHIVDCVLYFEGERLSNYRILRVIKNRFGPTGEIGIFEMTSSGLRSVEKIWEIFIPHRDNNISGSCLTCVVEGIRPLVVEVQALVTKSTFGLVKRKVSGFDFNRFSLILATIEKRLKLTLSTEDVFLNIAGGIKIDDPAGDLAVLLSIVSSYKDRPLNPNTVAIGEVGLGGEIRAVSHINLRLKEVIRAGFKEVIVPQSNYKEIDSNLLGSCKVISVSLVSDLTKIFMGG